MTASEPLNDNHIKLSDTHMVLAIFFFVVSGFAFLILWPSLAPSQRISAPLASAALPLFFVALSWGCRAKYEIARVISVGVGFIMVFMVPIGTALALMVILPATDWYPAPAGADPSD